MWHTSSRIRSGPLHDGCIRRPAWPRAPRIAIAVALTLSTGCHWFVQVPPHIADLVVVEPYCQVFHFAACRNNDADALSADCSTDVDRVFNAFLGRHNWKRLKRTYGGRAFRQAIASSGEGPEDELDALDGCLSVDALKAVGQVMVVANVIASNPDTVCIGGNGHFDVQPGNSRDRSGSVLRFDFAIRRQAHSIDELYASRAAEIQVEIRPHSLLDTAPEPTANIVVYQMHLATSDDEWMGVDLGRWHVAGLRKERRSGRLEALEPFGSLRFFRTATAGHLWNLEKSSRRYLARVPRPSTSATAPAVTDDCGENALKALRPQHDGGSLP